MLFYRFPLEIQPIYKVLWPEFPQLFLTMHTPIFFSQLSWLCINMEKNHAFSLFFSRDIVDLTILQFDCPRAFCSISQEPNFSQIWDLCKNTSNNTGFDLCFWSAVVRSYPFLLQPYFGWMLMQTCSPTNFPSLNDNIFFKVTKNKFIAWTVYFQTQAAFVYSNSVIIAAE